MTSSSKLKHSWQFEAIGTWWSIETAQPVTESQRGEIESRIKAFDSTYSRFRADSLVSKIADKAGEFTFPDDVISLLSFYRQLYNATDGLFSPLVGGLLSDAGYDKNYSLKPGAIRPVPRWDDVMQWHGKDLQTTEPIILDFGAAGKGYLVDSIYEILKKSGHQEFVVDASGDIRVQGVEETVGLEHPHDPTMVIGRVPITAGSICASATNRRTWGEWHHVVNPVAMEPVKEIVASWVIANTALVADAIATALFLVEPHRLSAWEFEYVRMLTDGSVERSSGFMGELFV